jgi:hypothetical protein
MFSSIYPVSCFRIGELDRIYVVFVSIHMFFEYDFGRLAAFRVARIWNLNQ